MQNYTHRVEVHSIYPRKELYFAPPLLIAPSVSKFPVAVSMVK